MADALARTKPQALARRESRVPFGIGATKPRHYLEMARIACKNSC